MNVKSQDSTLPCIAFFNFLGKSAIDLANNLGAVARTACDLASPEEINRLIEHGNKSLQS